MDNTAYKELGWDDVIENDGQTFVVLPEGNYDFTVTGVERARHAGSEKIPACNKAIVEIAVDSPSGAASIKTNFFLYSKFEWKLCQFFTCIGQRKHGETLRMNWPAVQGAKGRCKMDVKKWTTDKGEERTGNEVIEFLEPGEPVKYTPGAF